MNDISRFPAGGVLNALSLCSGIGGLDLGLERTGGIRIRGQAEIDPWCRSVLAARWPGVPLHDDVRTCARWWHSEPRPRIDLVCGGFPCQPHSSAGKRLGTADPRWLWPAFAAVIEAIRPPLVLLENVPRLVRSGLLDVLGDLAGLGFDAWWDRVPSAALGAPHLRWRFFLIAAHPGRVALRHEPWRGGGEDGASTAFPGFDGSVWSVADPLGPGLEDRRGEPGVDGEELAAAVRDGDRRGAGSAESGLGGGFDGPSSWLDGSWEHGIPRTVPRRGPDHVARLRATGNAVVPAVGEHAGRVLLGCCPEFRDD